MTAALIRRTGSMLAVLAAIAIGLVTTSGVAFAMPQQIGIVPNGSDGVVTAESISKSDDDDSACHTARCVVPVESLTADHLYQLHLVAAGPNTIGFVAVIEGQVVVVDRVEPLRTTFSKVPSSLRGIGFTEH
jgi:hypothetical protein